MFAIRITGVGNDADDSDCRKAVVVTVSSVLWSIFSLITKQHTFLIIY